MNLKYLCINCMKETSAIGGICPHCGFNPRNYKPGQNQLLPMTPLNGRYILGKVLGTGGFGITYLAYDVRLQIPVAIKELFIKNISQRKKDRSIEIPAASRRVFEENKKRFLQEAQILAMFRESDGVVSVKDTFEENHTAYIVMEYLEGETLKNKVAKTPLSYNEVKSLLAPVNTALQKIHHQGVLHLDISPDNIMVLTNHKAKLLDFGGAIVMNEKHAGFAYRPYYTPLEQRGSKGKIGPWTDIYAFGATIYFCLTGEKPQDAAERFAMEKFSEMQGNRLVSRNVEKVLKKAMDLDYTARYQKEQDFWKDFCRAAKNNRIQKKRIAIMLPTLIILTGAGIITTQIVFPKVVVPAMIYAEAEEKLKEKDYTEASQKYLSLGNYKDASEQAEEIQSAHPGYFLQNSDIITFGTYTQSKNRVKEPITWIVLKNDIENKRVLLVSQKALTCHSFNFDSHADDISEMAWEESDLKDWLNQVFLSKAFTLTERKKIQAVNQNSNKNSNGNADEDSNGTSSENSDGNANEDSIGTSSENSNGNANEDSIGTSSENSNGNDDEDLEESGTAKKEKEEYIFLLSYEEAGTLFKSDEQRCCKATAYAVRQGAYTDENGNCIWWLRTQGQNAWKATVVTSEGKLDDTGNSVGRSDCCVRPALWINIDEITEDMIQK